MKGQATDLLLDPNTLTVARHPSFSRGALLHLVGQTAEKCPMCTTVRRPATCCLLFSALDRHSLPALALPVPGPGVTEEPGLKHRGPSEWSSSSICH